MKILLVEDDLEISKLLAEFLQENGYEVFCQYDGLHVLDCLRENKIDLILLDIILFFLAIVFSALFVGNDFGQRTLQSYIIAGHNRGQILLAKLVAYQIACMTILALPLLVHGLIGRLCFKESFVSVSGNLYTVLAVVVSLFAMCLLPFFFALLFRDIGKTLAVPMVLFFLMIFLMNGDQALFISRILPMGQLRLIALQQFTPSMVQFVFTDFLWIFILYFGAYLGFRHSDLK